MKSFSISIFLIILFMPAEAQVKSASNITVSKEIAQAPIRVPEIFKGIPNGSILSLPNTQMPTVWELANFNNADLVQGVFDRSKEVNKNTANVSGTAFEMFNPTVLNKAVIKENTAYVRYNLMNGLISKGDYIAVSSEPGVGTKATKTGFTVGVALENSNDTEKEGLLKMRVMVRYEKFN